EATHPLAVTSESLLSTAVVGLKENVNYPRIKKLIFAACQHAWENDPAVLDQFDLKALLETLRQRYPTLPALRAQLNRIVAGLNRRASYEAVAATILMQLEPWYRHTVESTQLVGEATAFALSTTPQPYEVIALALEGLPDALRLRKLLYCICHNIWENDSSILENYSLERLVRQTHTVASTSQDLKYQLSRIVKRLNRKADYVRLANIIIEQFQLLYSRGPEITQISAPSPEDGIDGCADVTSIEQSAAAQEMTTMHTSLSVPIVSAGGVEPSPVLPNAPQDRTNLFALRQEIMRYANPLRAKVLLYSCLHGPFSFNPQDWSALKGQTLDRLIREIFEYCPTYADLESKLTILSHCLDNPDENASVASAIALAMKAYYPVSIILESPANPPVALPQTPPSSLDQTQTALSPA
ncbi:MAG TPA: hypothetical protein V6D06_03385, partial [Trichocoleus sp.]